MTHRNTLRVYLDAQKAGPKQGKEGRYINMDLTALRLLWALSEMEYSGFGKNKNMTMDHHTDRRITSDCGARVATGTYQEQETE